MQIEEAVKGAEAQQMYIWISFLDRTFLHKLMRLVYKLFRAFYVSVWFYFLPFLTLLGSYFVPYCFQLFVENAVAVGGGCADWCVGGWTTGRNSSSSSRSIGGCMIAC